MGLGLRRSDPDVLELRVHGINNTTAPALLDLRPEDVELVAGDKLGSFWRPKKSATDAIEQGGRGYVPKGITREAYSWGGMVRTTPNVGHAGTVSVVAAAATRVVYAVLLPFSIANAVQWTRRLPAAGDTRPRITAGLTRLFGLLLTLLYTSTAATVAIDIGAAQCAADPSLCAPMAAVFDPMAQWRPGYRFAVMGLLPVLAVGVLWIMSAVSRLRYDVLPGMRGELLPPLDEAHAAAPSRPAPTAPQALLSHPHFWSNRAARHIGRVHLAAALLLTAGLLAMHASFAWHTDCTGLGGFGTCVGTAFDQPLFVAFVWLAVAAATGLIAVVVVTVALPTPTLVIEEGSRRPWPTRLSAAAVAYAALVFAAVEGVLALAPGPDVTIDRLYGGGATPLAIMTLAALIAVSGVFWRGPRDAQGVDDRRSTAWRGTAPAVFMILALTLAIGTSAIIAVTTGDFLNGAVGAATLVNLHDAADGTLQVSSAYVATGTLVLAGLIVFLLAVAVVVLLPRRDVHARAKAWGAPTDAEDDLVPSGPSVLPPSPSALLARIEAKRVLAARVHLVEPAGAILAIVFAIAVVAALAWGWWTYALPGSSLESAAPDAIGSILSVSMPILAFVGLGLVATLASGAVTGGTRPLGTVWDIVCFLPRIGHPFGPPSYAERAVPEIAGRLFTWLEGHPRRRAVLAAHSMGGVLAVSSLGLLASTPETRAVLGRVSLLTFGVQLRPFFGRFLPELLGPSVLGTQPSLAPEPFAEDPWRADFAAQGGAEGVEPPAVGPPGRLRGQLLEGTDGVRWVSLWRLSDYLGYPAMSTAPAPPGGNRVDRIAEELDLSGYMVEVGTHGDYYRVPAYENAVEQLARL